jgi:hypothetical protein
MPMMTATNNARIKAMTGTKATARMKMVAYAAVWLLLPKVKVMLYYQVLEKRFKPRLNTHEFTSYNNLNKVLLN